MAVQLASLKQCSPERSNLVPWRSRAQGDYLIGRFTGSNVRGLFFRCCPSPFQQSFPRRWESRLVFSKGMPGDTPHRLEKEKPGCPFPASARTSFTGRTNSSPYRATALAAHTAQHHRTRTKKSPTPEGMRLLQRPGHGEAEGCSS